MKCLLYVPQYECEGIRADCVANVRVGGITFFQRACLSIQNAGFDEIILVKQAGFEAKFTANTTIPVETYDYTAAPDELSDTLISKIDDDPSAAFCILDGMLSPECLSMRPIGADVRITTEDEQTGVYFVSHSTAVSILKTAHGLDNIDQAVSETYSAPEKTLYHRMLSAEDVKISQNLLKKSLRKPLGRDADGLVAYFINRPCSLAISKHIANTPITPNMMTLIGLAFGLGAAGLVATGNTVMMCIAVVLWQFSSMIDGIDGELARMRMNPSHKGEWFDTVADDITNITFMLGLGHGLYMTGAQFPFMGADSSVIYFYVAAGVCTLMVIAVGWFYSLFVKLGIASHNHFEWGFETENKENKSAEHRCFLRRAADLIAGGFSWIAKRDFYTFLIMVLVLCGLYKTAYFVMLIGASFVGIGGIIALTLRAIRGALRK